jgi:hypothetical protein
MTGKDWIRESDDLYIHESGARIVRTKYQAKEGWFLMPADLTQAVQQFAPTDEGRAQAFEAFEKSVNGRARPAPKPAAKVRRPKRARAAAKGRGEEE